MTSIRDLINPEVRERLAKGAYIGGFGGTIIENVDGDPIAVTPNEYGRFEPDGMTPICFWVAPENQEANQ